MSAVDESHWNVRQWAEDHDQKDDFRFGIVWKVFGAVATILLAVLGWSLKAQYDNAYTMQQSVRDMQTAIVHKLDSQTQHFDQEN